MMALAHIMPTCTLCGSDAPATRARDAHPTRESPAAAEPELVSGHSRAYHAMPCHGRTCTVDIDDIRLERCQVLQRDCASRFRAAAARTRLSRCQQHSVGAEGQHDGLETGSESHYLHDMRKILGHVCATLMSWVPVTRPGGWRCAPNEKRERSSA